MTKKQIIELCKEAKELGATAIEVDGIKIEFGEKKVSHAPVPELDAKDLVNPMSVFDDLSDDEILFWSTPYYDELQVKKTTGANNQ